MRYINYTKKMKGIQLYLQKLYKTLAVQHNELYIIA